MPESELPWLVAGLPVYYHRSNGDRVSATVVDLSPRGGRRVSIRYELGGEEVLYEHAPEERLEFAIVTAESPDSPQPVHHEAPMDALLEPQLPEVEAEAPRIDDHEPECCFRVVALPGGCGWSCFSCVRWRVGCWAVGFVLACACSFCGSCGSGLLLGVGVVPVVSRLCCAPWYVVFCCSGRVGWFVGVWVVVLLVCLCEVCLVLGVLCS